MIRIESDWTAIDAELDRLSELPTEKGKKILQGVLDLAFMTTQEAVHVETGSLKSSGKKEDHTEHALHNWEGTITYGGESPGVNNPVDYAIYEKARGVHWMGPSSAKGDHDFMRPLDLFDPFWIAAVKGAM